MKQHDTHTPILLSVLLSKHDPILMIINPADQMLPLHKPPVSTTHHGGATATLFLTTQTPKPISHFSLKPPISPEFDIKCYSTHNSYPSDIDMVKTKSGFYAPKQNEVVILWDLDNKPPRGPPYEAAIALKRVAGLFGEVVDVSAFANRHAFVHVPDWVVDQRRERRHLDVLEKKGMVIPSQPYVCGVCGRKCKTNSELKKHFKQLHERERQKKLNRMYQLKGKKRDKYRERFVDGSVRYEEAARRLVTPKVGYGLEKELRRAGVFVKTVEDKPQAADWALKRQMIHSMSRGIDWLFLVSDDSDFKAMLRKVRKANLGTVVVGDWDRSLGRDADFWVSWIEVENGAVSEKDFVGERRRSIDWDEGAYRNDVDEMLSGSEGSDLYTIVDDLLTMSSRVQSDRSFDGFDDYLLSSDDESEEEEHDVYI
ncbi:hypothetical protein Droror1_Dr00013662 [Drosera rotundifolia]